MCTQEKLRGAENSKLQLEADNQALRDAVAEKKMEAERESRKKERMEKEMKELRANLEARQQEIKAKQQQVRPCQARVACPCIRGSLCTKVVRALGVSLVAVGAS